MTRKRIIIILLIIALILGGIAAYLIYFKKIPGLPFGLPGIEPGREAPAPGIGITPEEKLKQISIKGAVSPVLSADGSRIHYMGKEGDIFVAAFDGSETQQTPFTPLQNLIRVFWGDDRAVFAAAYGGTERKKFFFYDTKEKRTAPYQTTITALAISEKHNKLIYQSTAGLGDSPIIAVADADGNNAKTVIQARIRGIDLAWTSETEASLSTIPSGIAPGMLWLLNTTSGKLSSILSDVYGLTVRWAPSGESFLFSKTNTQGKNLSLSVSNKNGTVIKPVPLATLPEKCVFAHDERSVVCAAAETVPDIVWPDDYYKNIYPAPEQVWRINLTTGKKDLLYEFGGPAFDASELILSPDESILAFVNRKNGELYSLQIK